MFTKDAILYVERCAREGVDWDELEPKVEGAFELAGFEMTQDESLEIFESWLLVAVPEPEKATA